jgi:energy-coupling factor transport system substrate-specific component
MTWQLAAFGILGLGLVGGFVWYERSRPDARIIALVATLAAFAALGRIAFAALPNVKPTTDIVLVTGYVLGGAPGFVVGAIAGLTSNFFFGQGPWTPWQMAAWGATGLIGAGLATVTGRRVGRWLLATVCFVVGFAFAAVQDFGDWVSYSDHSADQLRVYVGKGLGFDLIHAVGCLLFALAFGPSLARSIQRFARRLTVTWRSAGHQAGRQVALVLVAVTVSSGWLASQPGEIFGGAGVGGTGVAVAAGTPAGYLLASQNGDGGFGSAPHQPSSQLYAGWVALGLAAAGHNPQDVVHDGHSLLAYVRAGAGSLPDTGSLERTILVARAAGVSAQNFGGHDLIAALEHRIRPDGSVSDEVDLTAFAVFALRSDGIAPASRTLSWLAHQQDSDGGFNFATAGGASDADDTGSALEALAGDPAASGVRGRAVAYLGHHQNPDGGFPSDAGGPSNAQSTAFGVQGLIAAGVDLGSLPHGPPDHYLSSLTGSDGHVHYSRASDQTPIWVTGQALMALSGKPLPIVPAARPPSSHHATTTKPTKHRRSHHTRPRPAATHRGHHPKHAAASLLWLASAAGIVTAVVLAPVGA